MELKKLKKRLKSLKKKRDAKELEIEELKDNATKYLQYNRASGEHEAIEALGKFFTCEICKTKTPTSNILKYRNKLLSRNGRLKCSVCNSMHMPKGLRSSISRREKAVLVINEEISTTKELLKEKVKYLLKEIRGKIQTISQERLSEDWSFEGNWISLSFRNDNYATHESYGHYEGDEVCDLIKGTGILKKIKSLDGAEALAEISIGYHEKCWFSIDIEI